MNKEDFIKLFNSIGASQGPGKNEYLTKSPTKNLADFFKTSTPSDTSISFICAYYKEWSGKICFFLETNERQEIKVYISEYWDKLPIEWKVALAFYIDEME